MWSHIVFFNKMSSRSNNASSACGSGGNVSSPGSARLETGSVRGSPRTPVRDPAVAFEQFVTGELVDMKRILSTLLNQSKILADNQKKIMGALVPGEGGNGGARLVRGGISERKNMTAKEVFFMKVSNAAGVVDGLFTYSRFGDYYDGHKRSAVLFRQLAKKPYCSDEELLGSFIDGRMDVPESVVIEWFKEHKEVITMKYRDRRSSFVRQVKERVSLHFSCGKIPVVAGNAGVMKKWKRTVGDNWDLAKFEARKSGLHYPRVLTSIVERIAQQSDTYVQYKAGFVEENIEQSEFAINLIILEAYACNVVAVCFGKRACDEEVECNDETLGGEALVKAMRKVVLQRARYDDEEVDGDFFC